MLPEAQKVKRAIEHVADAEINKLTAPCFRVYKGVITEAPNGSTCKVRLVGDETELTLPYASKLSKISVGAHVWVGAFYATDNNLSNAIVWETLKFNELTKGKVYTCVGIGMTSADGILNLPIDVTKFRITQISLANFDTAYTVGANDLYIYGADTLLYKTGTTTYATISAASLPENTCNVDFGSGTTWSNNANMNVVALYTEKSNYKWVTENGSNLIITGAMTQISTDSNLSLA